MARSRVQPASPLTADHVRRAVSVVAQATRETPVLPAHWLERRVGGEIWLKLESLQATGSFKVRGATNRMHMLHEPERSAGVFAASAGNHAQAIAWSARRLGTTAMLFMPRAAPLAKIAAVQAYGGRVTLVDGMLDEALVVAREAAEAAGGLFIHAFDDPAVIAGQGTLGLELARQVPAIATAIVPLGGGGLISGVALALRQHNPGVRIVGVQAAAIAPYAGLDVTRCASTICDGIAVKQPGALTRPLVERLVDEVVTVTDDEVAQAMALLLQRSKQVVEGAGAVGIAALLHGRTQPARSGATVVVVSGGNVDPAVLVEAVRLHETADGRQMILATRISDRPGGLAALLGLVAELGANVLDVEHLREGVRLHMQETGVQLVLQTRGPEHDREILDAVHAAGYATDMDPHAPRETTTAEPGVPVLRSARGATTSPS
jgi:threonine dehydratase